MNNKSIDYKPDKTDDMSLRTAVGIGATFIGLRVVKKIIFPRKKNKLINREPEKMDISTLLICGTIAVGAAFYALKNISSSDNKKLNNRRRKDGLSGNKDNLPQQIQNKLTVISENFSQQSLGYQVCRLARLQGMLTEEIMIKFSDYQPLKDEPEVDWEKEFSFLGMDYGELSEEITVYLERKNYYSHQDIRSPDRFINYHLERAEEQAQTIIK